MYGKRPARRRMRNPVLKQRCIWSFIHCDSPAYHHISTRLFFRGRTRQELAVAKILQVWKHTRDQSTTTALTEYMSDGVRSQSSKEEKAWLRKFNDTYTWLITNKHPSHELDIQHLFHNFMNHRCVRDVHQNSNIESAQDNYRIYWYIHLYEWSFFATNDI